MLRCRQRTGCLMLLHVNFIKLFKTFGSISAISINVKKWFSTRPISKLFHMSQVTNELKQGNDIQVLSRYTTCDKSELHYHHHHHIVENVVSQIYNIILHFIQNVFSEELEDIMRIIFIRARYFNYVFAQFKSTSHCQ